MPWCPKCKNEYVEGIKICSDCKEELVDSLESEETVREREDGQMQKLKELSGENPEDILPRDEKGLPGYPLPASTGSGVYEDSAKKAEENRSSGYMLLIVGSIGLAVMILIFTGFIPISMSAMSRYMTCGVMSGLFILFIVMGVLSMKSSKVLAKKAEKENNLTSEIKKWCEINLTAERIDNGLFEETDEDGEEIKYFKRIEKMKAQISYQFLNLDEGFLDAFVDDYYQNIYGEARVQSS